MLSKEVKKWLTECKCVSNEAINAFASTLANNEQLILGLYALFDTPPYHAQELDPVCHQLYEFYRSNEKKLKQFSLQFSSVLIWLYLHCLGQGDTEVCGGVETFLLGIYNLEIVKLDGSPVVESVCIPTINKTSIYHESRGAWVAEPLTERALHSLSPYHAMLRYGPFPQYERFSARNRFTILSYIMQHYNGNIDSFHRYSLQVLCQMTIKLSSTGFSISQDSEGHHQPRINVNPPLLLEFLFAVYFALFNGHHKIAIEAVQAVHNRSSFELYSDILLVTGAILNSYCYGNLQFDITHASLGAQRAIQVLKNLVTNASFKAKKLPDDIDIVEEVQQRLPAIMEDQEYSLAKGLKTRLMNLGGKLGGDRNKNRDAIKQDGDISSPKQGGKVEFTDTSSVSGQSPGSSGDGRDSLESQRSKGNNSRNGTDAHMKVNNDEKHTRSSPATVVFSKKTGILKQLSLGASGIGTKTTDASTKASYSFTTSSPLSSSSHLTKASLSTHNKSTSGHNMSVTNNITHSTSKSNSSESTHGNPMQSQPSRNESKSSTSTSSSSALLQPSSQSIPNLSHNSSEPLLAQHSSSNSQAPASAKSYSTFAETFLSNMKRPSQKSINKSSVSTDL